MDRLSEWQLDRFVEEVTVIGRTLGNGLQRREYHAVIAVDVPECQLDAGLLPLSSAERERSKRYHHIMDRNRSLIARSTLRILLGTLFGTAPNHVTIGRAVNGKPFIVPGPSFSISHSGALAVVALSGADEIGIDLEEVRREDAIIPFLAETLSPGETRYVGIQPNETMLLRAWTRKEAVAKLSGEGLFREFRLIEVLHEDGHNFQCHIQYRERDTVVHGKDLEIRPGYLSALASTSSISEVTRHHVAVSKL